MSDGGASLGRVHVIDSATELAEQTLAVEREYEEERERDGKGKEREMARGKRERRLRG